MRARRGWQPAWRIWTLSTRPSTQCWRAVCYGSSGRRSTLPDRPAETLRLAQDGARFFAVANAAASVIAGLGAGYAGLLLAQALAG